MIVFALIACLPSDELARLQAATTQKNERVLATALQQAGVAFIALEQRTLLDERHAYVEPEGPMGEREPWRTFIEGTTTWIASDVAHAYCIGDVRHANVRFVRARDGRVYKLVERRRERAKAVSACDCRSWNVPSCGAPTSIRSQLAYALPAGATYAGEKTIAYDAQTLAIQWKADSACPPPQTPP